jgi:hypothetical protein
MRPNSPPLTTKPALWLATLDEILSKNILKEFHLRKKTAQEGSNFVPSDAGQ